jgi:hypothetical protein
MSNRNKKYREKQTAKEVMITVIHVLLGSITRIIKTLMKMEVGRNPNRDIRIAMMQRLPRRQNTRFLPAGFSQKVSFFLSAPLDFDSSPKNSTTPMIPLNKPARKGINPLPGPAGPHN